MANLLRIGLPLLPALFLLPAAHAQWTLPATQQPPANSPATATPSAASAATPAAATPTAAPQKTVKRKVDVPGDQDWTDTGIVLAGGETIAISAGGTLTGVGGDITPAGLARSWADLLRAYTVNDGGAGALIARVGDDAPFLIGAQKSFTTLARGHLFLGINKVAGESYSGKFTASIEVTGAAPAAAQKLPALAVDAKFLDALPRRVSDANGKPGDLVNFILIGPEASVTAAFQDAGWVSVDKSTSEGVLHAVLASIDKQAYVQMPMSVLYLFGRPQDYGFAHAQPVSVIAERNHLRLWKVDVQYNGEDVWVGAATHDMGFERDQRNGGVTHHIDPDIDTERAYVQSTLEATGEVVASTLASPSAPITNANTATGGEIQSDGRVLVMQLLAKQ